MTNELHNDDIRRRQTKPKKRYSYRQLENLWIEYVNTLDKEIKDEWYCTPRALANRQIKMFLDWIKENK